LSSFAQQDPQYSQYQFNQMVINPAYAGSRDALSAVIDVRQQWSGFDGAPRTQAFSLHGPLKKKRIGLGLSGYADQIGPKKTVGVYGTFAYILPINNKLKLSFGLRGGILSYNFDWNKISYQNPNEGALNYAPQSQHTVADVDAGLFLKSNSFYGGVSATHINGAKVYNEKIVVVSTQSTYDLNYTLNPHLFFIVSKGFKLNDNLIFNPTLMIKHVSSVNSTDINLNFLIKQRAWVGVFVRGGNTVGALAQFYITPQFRIGYTYDTSLGKTQKQLGSGHEIMIGFDFNTFKSKMLSPRYL
jgi:type IX secretion system PorP/SprF family membrane protein